MEAAGSGRFSNNYGRSSGGGGGGGGYGYPDSTASSCVSVGGGGLGPDDVEREGAGGGGGGSTVEAGKKDYPLPRGTPSASSRSHRKGRSLADSTASTITPSRPSRLLEGSASSTTTETATATDATPQRGRLDGGESDDPLSTSFSEFSSDGSRRVEGFSTTTPRRAGTGGGGFNRDAPGIGGGGGGRRRRGGQRGGGGGLSTAGMTSIGGCGDPNKLLEMLVGGAWWGNTYTYVPSSMEQKRQTS